MTVLAPADPADAAGATRAALAHDGPVYLRLGKNGEAPVLPAGARFTIGRAVTVREGGDVALLSTGAILAEVVAAADRLAAAGVRATVLHLGTLKPLDTEAIARVAARTRAVVTVEEHTVLGGLGSAVAETLAEHGVGARLRRLGVPDAFAHAVGSRQHLLTQVGLDAPAIARAAHQLVGAAQLVRAA
jgi:transketolase